MTRPAPGAPEDVLHHIRPGDDLVVAMAAGEPFAALDAIEAGAAQLDGVRIHQMHAMQHRPSMDGALLPHLRHVSYFLSGATRASFRAGGCDLVPADFSAMPRVLRTATRCSLILLAVSPPDADGWCSLGTNAEYVAPLLRDHPCFLEVNHAMPRTRGPVRVNLKDAVGWYEVDRPLPTVTHPEPDARDHAIAAFIAERIPHGATLQLGIGNLPEALTTALRDHRDLGIHSELLSDGTMHLIESGVVTGVHKRLRPGIAVGTFAMGSERFYRWLGGDAPVELHPVDWVNDPRVIAEEPVMVSVNATTEVDLYGQCASETVAGRYYSASGGQGDFATGAFWSPGGEAFVALRSTTRDGASRIRVALTAGSVVTTSKNVIDHVVTEHGVASLRGRTLAERARQLIAIAAPEHRDALAAEARAIGLLP